MDLKDLKNEFGKEIVFQGAIDVQHVLSRETPQEVEDEVRKVIDILAPGRRLSARVVAKSHDGHPYG